MKKELEIMKKKVSLSHSELTAKFHLQIVHNDIHWLIYLLTKDYCFCWPFLSFFFLSWFLSKEGIRLKVHEKKFLNFQKQIVELENKLSIVKILGP